MVAQPNSVDEVEVGIDDVLWLLSTEHPDEHRHDALDDDGVAVGTIGDHTVAVLCVEPQAALASVNEIVGGLLALVERFKRVSQINDVGIAVHPVVHVTELLYYFVLQLIDIAHFVPLYR